MLRLLALAISLMTLFAPGLYGYAPKVALEINAVKVYVDRSDRIHVFYQKECGARFAGFLLRPTAEKELLIAALSYRPSTRCLELSPMEEVILPSIKASDFAAVSSLNPSVEPQMLKASPIQNFNQIQDGENTRFEVSFTSQCATQLGLMLYPGAKSLEISVLEGRNGRFETCNRSTKLASYPGIDFGGARLATNTQFFEDEPKAVPYSLRRAQTKLVKVGEVHTAYYFRRCTEAPVGLIREKKGDDTIYSVLVANYADTSCPEGTPRRLWTPWPEDIHDEHPLAFAGTQKAETLTIKRPISYNIEKDRLTVGAYSSCQKDIGIVSRESSSGYAIGILQIQSSLPCNSSMKEVNFTFEWNFAHGVKRDIKPLHLVGS